MQRTLRRQLLAAGSAALLLPMMGRADDGGDDPDPRRFELGATSTGGRTRYTSCGSTFEVAYGGVSAHVAGGGPGGPSYRAELGGAIARNREVANEEGPVEDADARWEPSFYTFAQVGEDWKWFGFLIGGGIAGRDSLAPLPALTLRIGPRRPLRLDLHLLDMAPFERGLAGFEVVFFPSPRIEMGVGMRAQLEAEAPIGTFRVDIPIGNGMRMGLLGGAGEMAGDLVLQGELAVRASL